MKTQNVYVIDITDVNHGWVENPVNVRQAVEETLNPKGFHVISISNLEDLDNLVRNPPLRAVIVNGHGESIPIPRSWQLNWRLYMRKMGENLRDYGWILVSITGYPLFYCDQNLTPNQTWISSEDNGLNSLLSVVQARSHGVGVIARVNLTPEGRKAANLANLELPSTLAVSRCMLWKNITPARIFYGFADLCGASALRIGNGMFVHNGMMSVDLGYGISSEADYFLGKISAALVLDLFSPPVIGPPNIDQRVNKLISDLGSSKLRRLFRKEPENEAEVQDRLEDFLEILEYDFRREQVTIPYAGKAFCPDFTSESLHTAMETKLCKRQEDHKRIIEEINADIPAYKTKYPNIIFVVYDVGIIRDVLTFKTDIETNNPGVHVLVIKH